MVAAAGNTIRLAEELEPGLRDLAMRPSVGRRRVLIIEAADRLRDQEGSSRILKLLEEPPERSHMILVTDRPADLLPTIRSRCIPVPFRPIRWQLVAERLVADGMSPDDANGLARAAGPAALAADPAERSMRLAGVELGVRALTGRDAGLGLVSEIQQRMAEAATGRSSDELVALRAAADALAGKRGEKTARKRADDQEKREVRRAMTDGWVHVLDGAAEAAADAIAIAVGASGSVRYSAQTGALAEVATPERQRFLEHAFAEIGRTRAELELNPTIDLAVFALLTRIGEAREGRPQPLTPPGRLPT